MSPHPLIFLQSNRVTLKMDVSHTEHSHVIGKGGNNIKRVMESTGCHIHFPDSNRNNQSDKSNQVSVLPFQHILPQVSPWPAPGLPLAYPKSAPGLLWVTLVSTTATIITLLSGYGCGHPWLYKVLTAADMKPRCDRFL